MQRGIIDALSEGPPMQPKTFKRQAFANVERVPCYLCGCRLTFDKATVDHLLPLAKGGKNTKANYRIACKRCNNKRGCTMPDGRVLKAAGLYTWSAKPAAGSLWDID